MAVSKFATVAVNAALETREFRGCEGALPWRPPETSNCWSQEGARALSGRPVPPAAARNRIKRLAIIIIRCIDCTWTHAEDS